MRELYVETRHLLLQKGLIDEGKLNLNTVGLWWAFWLGCRIVGYIVFRVMMEVEDVDTLRDCTVASMIVEGVNLLLGFLAIKVIRDYASVEPILYEMPDEEDSPSQEGLELAGSV
jgi:hypothetical protein